MKKLLIGMTIVLNVSSAFANQTQWTYGNFAQNLNLLRCDHYIDNYNVINDRIMGSDIILEYDNGLETACDQNTYELKRIKVPKVVAAELGIIVKDFGVRKFQVIRDYGQPLATYTSPGEETMTYEGNMFDLRFLLKDGKVTHLNFQLLPMDQYKNRRLQADNFFEAWRDGGKWESGHKDFNYKIESETCKLTIEHRFSESEFSYAQRFATTIDLRNVYPPNLWNMDLSISASGDYIEQFSSGDGTVRKSYHIMKFDDSREANNAFNALTKLVTSCAKY